MSDIVRTKLVVALFSGKIFGKPIQAAYFLTNSSKAIRLFIHKWRFFCHSCQAADLTLISKSFENCQESCRQA